MSHEVQPTTGRVPAANIVMPTVGAPMTTTNAVTVSDPMPPLPFEVTEEARKRFAAPKIQVLALLPKSHRTVWLAGFSPLLSPNVRTTRCPKGIIFALGNLTAEELARAVPILLLDKPLCLHFTKFGSCNRVGCRDTCSHRDELQVKTLIAVRFMQLQQASKSDVKRMVQKTLQDEDITESCQIPKRFIYYKDAHLENDGGDDGVVGEGGYTEAGQRRMRTEEEGDEILAEDENENNVIFENAEAREAFIEDRAKQHEARRHRLLDAARKNAVAIPPLPVVPPDVDLWYRDKKVVDAYYQAQGLPPVNSTTLMILEKQAQRDPSELFPPLPNISFADGKKKSYGNINSHMKYQNNNDTLLMNTFLEMYQQQNTDNNSSSQNIAGGYNAGFAGTNSVMVGGNNNNNTMAAGAGGGLLGNIPPPPPSSLSANNVLNSSSSLASNNIIQQHQQQQPSTLPPPADEATLMMSMFSQPLESFASSNNNNTNSQQQYGGHHQNNMMMNNNNNSYHHHQNNNYGHNNNSNNNVERTNPTGTARVIYTCTNCGRTGHTAKFCRQAGGGNHQQHQNQQQGSYQPNVFQQQQPAAPSSSSSTSGPAPDSGSFGLL